MKSRLILVLVLVLLTALPAAAAEISGDYLEARTADVWTGPCFANSEVGLTGKEAVLAWRVRHGGFEGVALEGLSVVVVVRTEATLGDPHAGALDARSVLLVDETATPEQRRALEAFARHMAPELTTDVVAVRPTPIRLDFDRAEAFAHLEAGETVELATRPLGHHDVHCGNESVYYPPLAEAEDAVPAATVAHSFRGEELGKTWSSPNKRSAFLATFSR